MPPDNVKLFTSGFTAKKVKVSQIFSGKEKNSQQQWSCSIYFGQLQRRSPDPHHHTPRIALFVPGWPFYPIWHASTAHPSCWSTTWSLTWILLVMLSKLLFGVYFSRSFIYQTKRQVQLFPYNWNLIKPNPDSIWPTEVAVRAPGQISGLSEMDIRYVCLTSTRY